MSLFSFIVVYSGNALSLFQEPLLASSDEEFDYHPNELAAGDDPARASADEMEAFFATWDEAKEGDMFVVEEGYPTLFPQKRQLVGLDGPEANILTPERFAYLKAFHMTAPSMQYHLVAKSLRHPHYTTSKEVMRQVLLHPDARNVSRKFYSPRDPGPSLEDPLGFLNVWRGPLTPSVAGELRAELTPQEDIELNRNLVREILRYGMGDDRRGNRFIDYGYCSDVCTSRKNDPNGLAVPNQRVVPQGVNRTLLLDGVSRHSVGARLLINPRSAAGR